MSAGNFKKLINPLEYLSQSPNSENALLLGVQYSANFSSYIDFCRVMAQSEEMKEYVLPNFDEIETQKLDEDEVETVKFQDDDDRGIFEKSGKTERNGWEFVQNRNFIERNEIPMNYTSNFDDKPAESYAYLIFKALETSSTGKLTLSEIYAWIESNYPYYRTADPVWKNSIRHNLSLNQTFVKIPRPLNSKGKGGYWAIDTSQRQSVLRKGRKAPEYKGTHINDEMLGFKANRMIY
jgi:hypothetical protein